MLRNTIVLLSPLYVWLAFPAAAQDNPVFLDNSTLAADVFAGLPGLLASDNTSEAVRLLQRLLDDDSGRLIVSDTDTDLFEPVRARVHRVLLNNAALLKRYRSAETDAAALAMEAGQTNLVERTRLLTRPGFEAALRVAAEHLNAGRFESARLTLTQLDTHPDRTDRALADRAAALWAQLAAYIPRDDVLDDARRWADAAGQPFIPPEPTPWPASLRAPVWTPQHPAEPFTLTDLVNSPLCSAPLRTDTAAEDDAVIRTRRGRPTPEFPYLYPTVSGDTVYTNDGLWIAAWDRFTLTPKWRTKPRGADYEREELESLYASAPYRRNNSRDAEESNTLTISGRLLLAATGVVTNGSRSGDPRLHAIDTRTGRVLWSTYIDELDPQLQESSTRGPALIEGDTAIVAVRKISQARRFASAFLVGINLADGSVRWVRLCGSAGWLSYGGRGQWSDWPTLHHGVVYRADELGVISAVEAGSGRFRWVRQLPGVESRLPTSRLPWASSQPIIDGDTLLTLSPDRSELLRLDLKTGAILGRRTTQDFGSQQHRPGYIFAHNGRLVAVSPTSMASVSIANAIDAPLRVSKHIPAPGIMGRVVAGGDALLVPVETGVAVLDFQSFEPVAGIPLDAPGNVLPLRTQLLTIDNQQLHSYLVWEDAAAVLAERLDANPADTNTAITFAELAARAERYDSVLDPVDRALDAMALDPLSPTLRPAQQRLFTLLLGILRESERPIPAAPDNNAALPDPIPADVLEGVAARMEAVAVEPAERATHLLMRAALRDKLGNQTQAVADCQAVLADPDLAAAAWARGASSVRAELHALATLDRLLDAGSPDLYAPFENQARLDFAALDPQRTAAAAYESLARAYPRSSTAPAAWLAAASVHTAKGRPLAADHAYARGIEAAQASRAVGVPVENARIAELLGGRLLGLVNANRLDTATSLLHRIESHWPGLDPVAHGEPVDRDAISALLQSRYQARNTRATIGDTITPNATELPGWVLMRSLDRHDAFTKHPGVMMLTEGRVGLWKLAENGTPIEPAWTAPYATKPALLRHQADRILLFEPSDQGGIIRALDPNDGRELWKADHLAEALATARGPVGGAQERFDAPLDGRVNPSDLLLAIDETSVALVSRSGRVVSVDLATGRVAWARRTVCQRVNDCAAGDGVLVLAGTSTPPNDDSAGEPIILTLDLASGEEISRFSPAQGHTGSDVRWVHVAPGTGRAIVGFARGIVALSLPEAIPQWSLTDIAVEQTAGAWSIADRLFVQTTMRELVLIDPQTGALIDDRLDTAGCLELGEPIDAVENNSKLVLLSPAGFASIDPLTGELLAADAITPLANSMVQPTIAHNRIVMVERDPLPGAPGVYRLHLLDATTGRALHTQTLALRDRPRRLGLLDGVILITAGDSTVVLPTK
ncbi:MAG: PQQ-binding-like beta-propeller repeat protein [Planctomycetota bacterium]|nr:PQQ-binding-like beta-propeller repeat protein [Planctomycetota bacterium]